MVLPAGSPYWARVSSHVDYGGHISKRNYLSQGVINAQTDFGAEALMRMAADMEAFARVMPFAIMTVQNNDSTASAPTVQKISLGTAVTTAPYAGNAPPTGFPSAARPSDTVATITMASSYTDPYGVSAAYVPRYAIASPTANPSYLVATCTISGNVITVYVTNTTTGTAVSNALFTLMVY